MAHHGSHLILVNLGTPVAPTADSIRLFLREFLSDPAVVDYPGWLWRPVLERMVLSRRPHVLVHQYASIWQAEGSPLRLATERLGEAVRLAAGNRVRVHVAYRYGEPSLEAVIARAGSDGASRIVVSPLFPHRTGSTTGTAFERARQAAREAGVAHLLVERLTAAADDGYIAALAARWREALRTVTHVPQHLVISFHGIPRRYNRAERGVYVRDCETTTRAFLRAIQWPADAATLAYQSKFGPEPWLTPATADVLRELPRRGVASVAVITPGFLTDGLETLEEIGGRGADTFRAAGGRDFLRVGAVEEHPAYVESLLRLALDAAGPDEAAVVA